MLRYIVFLDNSFWIAQGLEADICAQGRTAAEACERFEATVRAEALDAGEEGRNFSISVLVRTASLQCGISATMAGGN